MKLIARWLRQIADTLDKPTKSAIVSYQWNIPGSHFDEGSNQSHNITIKANSATDVYEAMRQISSDDGLEASHVV